MAQDGSRLRPVREGNAVSCLLRTALLAFRALFLFIMGDDFVFELQHLRYRRILHIDHLQMERAVTCITGPSGSGKSTLLRLLNRLIEPTAGTILYNHEPLVSIDPVMLRRRVVMLGQTPVVYPGTVADNLQVGLRFSERSPASLDAMRAVLQRVQLGFAPDDRCDTMSGGEKQRLCLGRVLLMEAETYLLDEPSAALDNETERLVIDSMADFVREHGSQMVMVTHSEAVAARFPEGCIEIAQGRMSEK